MKSLILLLIAALAPATASAVEALPLYRGVCILYVNSSKFAEGPNIYEKIALNAGEQKVLGTYAERIYEVASFDNTSENDLRPRRQLILSVRDAKTKELLGAANASYSQEVPEQVSLQTNSDDLFYCAAH